MIPFDRAARRYFQIRGIQKAIDLCEDSIADVQREITQANERLSELRATKRSLQGDMREAARDHGELPLIDLIEELGGEAVKN